MCRQRLSKKRHAVFMDRDGVINRVVLRDGKYVSPRTIQQFRWVPHILEAIMKLKDSSFYVFVITNQPDISRKKMSLKTLGKMSELMRSYLPIDDIQICPHDSTDNCLCRKPRPGMIMDLADKWNVDLKSSFVFGDSWKDMEAGKASGCTTILMQTNYNKETESHFKVRTVLGGVRLIKRLREIQ